MKYEYMKESEQMLQYFQFPKFLLKLRISQTAKFLYMILYDRARISRKNSWIDKYGNVYLIFPIEELSVQIDKCKSSVKTALKELDDVGLLVRRSGGFSKPNHLYVKIPSDEIGLQTVDDKAVEKMAVIESEMVDGKSGFLYFDKNESIYYSLHWEHYFQHIIQKYNNTYKVQMPVITPHVCRHTYCSNMAKSGMNPKALQYLMGHSDISVTLNTYTHVNLEDAREEVARIQVV